MKKILLLILIITSSCKEKTEAYSMYGLLNEELSYTNETLKLKIDEDLQNDKLRNNESAKKYDRLTKSYLTYLDKIYSKLINNPKIDEPTYYEGELSKKEYINDLFFKENQFSENGIEFISKMDNYRDEILKLVKDENLKKRIHIILSTMPIHTRDKQKIKYLNFFFKDMPLISVLTYIKNKERSILGFENEFLKNRQLN